MKRIKPPVTENYGTRLLYLNNAKFSSGIFSRHSFVIVEMRNIILYYSKAIELNNPRDKLNNELNNKMCKLNGGSSNAILRLHVTDYYADCNSA